MIRRWTTLAPCRGLSVRAPQEIPDGLVHLCRMRAHRRVSGVVDAHDISLQSWQESAELNWTDLVPVENGWKVNVARLESALVRKALSQAEGNKSRAAELLGIQRRLLYDKLREQPIEGVDAYVTNKEVDGKTLAELAVLPSARGVFLR